MISSREAAKIFNNNVGLRDSLFIEILSSFNKQPLNVVQIGAIEILEDRFRQFSGWSDGFWGSYIKYYGGSLTICDIDFTHLKNSITLSGGLGYEAKTLLVDGFTLLQDIKNLPQNKYPNLIYLDGSNDPQETKNQFDLCNTDYAKVIVDDFKIKGTLLNQDDWDIRYIANEVGIYKH